MSARIASTLARGVQGYAPPLKFGRFRRSKISSGPISSAFYSEVYFLVVFFSEHLYTNSLILMAEAYVVIQHE